MIRTQRQKKGLRSQKTSEPRQISKSSTRTTSILTNQIPLSSSKRPVSSSHSYSSQSFGRRCASTSSSSSSTASNTQSIPRLRYLTYDESTDVLAILKSRGLINQMTNGTAEHFGSAIDTDQESLTSAVQSAYSGATPRLYGNGDVPGVTSESTRDVQFRPIADPTIKRTIYAGFDPTASSLHLGNLLVMTTLKHFHQAGHQIVALTGGATGMVGDPSGRSSERVLQTADQVKANTDAISSYLHQFLHKNDHNQSNITFNKAIINDPSRLKPIEFVDNYDWYQGMSIIDFLRDIGKFMRVKAMMAKDSVKNRLEESDEGLSLTEFSYQALQGYDFYHLNKTYGVTVQIGGSDQWGNITAGTDLTQRIIASKTSTQSKQKGSAPTEVDPSNIQSSVHGMTIPLLTTASGVKFGKSMGNAVWLDDRLTSPYQMYQYLLQTNDDDLCRFLRVFTFLTEGTIQEVIDTHSQSPESRLGQRVLACELVRLIHGDFKLKQAIAATKLLFEDKYPVDLSPYVNQSGASESDGKVTSSASSQDHYHGLTLSELLDSLAGVSITHIPTKAVIPPPPPTKGNKSSPSPVSEVPIEDTSDEPVDLSSLGIHQHPHSLVNLAVTSKLCNTKADVRRLMKNGGFYVNNTRISEDAIINREDLPFGRVALLRSGQKKIHVAVLEAM